jgi:NADH dehydrogenase [ubiquinone] 1 alpha subcomplex assembly factor 7
VSDRPAAPASLAEHLARRIMLDGPLTVASFMAEALGHPRFGYYITRDPLGAAGDFTTAPEISQMFGELVGLWCADVWMRMGAPDKVAWVELGPGRGTLTADALRALKLVPPLRAALEVHLVETSPALRARQAATLDPAATGTPAPAWHDSLDSLPEDRPLLIVANEFFDALPVRQIQKTAEGWAERLVDVDETATALAGRPCFRFVLEAGRGPGRAAAPGLFRDAPVGSIYEWSPASAAVAGALGARLAAQGGAALIFDYGYAGPALGDTLQALRRHAFAPVLQDPGEADLTAHVDFTALADAADIGGGRVWGPVDQGDFLRALGVEQRAAALAQAAPGKAAEIHGALNRLTADDQMGKLFKTLCISSPGLEAPAGFPI